MRVLRDAHFLLCAFLCFLRFFGRLPTHAGEHLLERFLRAHLLATAFVVSVLVFGAAGAATRLADFFSHHDHNGMIGCALAARAIIVDVITQSGHKKLLAGACHKMLAPDFDLHRDAARSA